MSNISFNCIFTYLNILLTLFVFGCASHLPHEKIESIDHHQVEYSLIRNNNGSAIVVFENGLDGKMNSWNKIVPEISREATTFAYNRSGYGRSDPVSTLRDGLHIIDELRSLLRSNGLKPPYVLVGHSFGGLYMQLFARRYPEEVTGLVLVDSTHPNHFKGKGSIDNWPAWIRLAFLSYLSSTAKEELNLINITGDEVLALPSFTGKPVIVLSALWPMEEKSTISDDANEKRKDIVNLYTGSKQVWVDSGHDIPKEKPESVIKAIREVLQSAGKTEGVMNMGQMGKATPLPNKANSADAKSRAAD
ncbi:MAG: alpha/beta hydrolase [Chromatiales bacterium]|nr:alpha/beta hydrolase [Chromatiales bacterium]